ncbi:MAG: hypothetical protein IH965_15125 [Gemmatimonadetes bacterium]|nr:hypothetical protein [Gemmatimonadota bacterium]
MSRDCNESGRVMDAVESNDAAAIDRLKEWLSIPSVGADPAFRDDTRRAARWAADQLIAAAIHLGDHLLL